MVLIALILFNKIYKYKKIKVLLISCRNKFYQIQIEALSLVIIKNKDHKLESPKVFLMGHCKQIFKTQIKSSKCKLNNKD